MRGNLSPKLYPLRLNSRTPLASRRAMTRHNTGSMQFERIERVIVEHEADDASDLQLTNGQGSW